MLFGIAKVYKVVVFIYLQLICHFSAFRSVGNKVMGVFFSVYIPNIIWAGKLNQQTL